MLNKSLLSIIAAILLLSFSGQGQSNYISQVGLIDSLKSQVLNESREYYVQLPDSYVPGSPERYPVIYLLDGATHLNTLHNIQSYYSGGFLPEMILIGVSNKQNRTRDLTTSKIEDEKNFYYKQEHGEAENFMKFLTSELIPHIEEKYPVTSYRTIIGHSYGGLFAINSLLKNPSVFQNYLAIDPSMDWNDQNLLKYASQHIEDVDLSKKSLFIALGGQLHMANSDITLDNVMKDTTDMTLFARSNIGFSELAETKRDKGLRFYWKYYPNDLHGTVPLPAMLDGLLAIFEWYQMENVDSFNDPEASSEELLAIIKHRENKLHDHFGYKVAPYPDFLLNMKGYMSMDMNRPDLAKMYFTCYTEYFPEDANAYDSLADYYESQNEYDKALESVTKAYEISGSEDHKKRLEDLKSR